MSLFAKLSAAATALLLAACASAPATQYFSLPDSAFVPPAGQSSGQTAVQIILAEPPPGFKGFFCLNFARHHLWAAPLDQSLAAAFSNRLNRHGSARFVPYGRGNDLPVLKIYIEQFQGSFQGHTLVSGYAQWPNGRTTPFNIQTPQQGDGYPAMVESLSQGLNHAADTVGGH